MSQWKIYKDVNLYFITSSIESWQPVFTDSQYFNIIIDSLNYCVKYKSLVVHGYVIMLDHIHLLASNGQDKPFKLSGIMRDFKRHTSRCITKQLEKDHQFFMCNVFKKAAQNEDMGNEYKVWQTGFHPIAVMTNWFCRQKLDYIHKNPVKKGYVVEPEHWFYSSARNYAGLHNKPMEVELL